MRVDLHGVHDIVRAASRRRLLRELLALSDSDEFMARAPAILSPDGPLVGWRLYDTRDSLEFLFEATNESSQPVVVDQLRLRDGITLTLSDGRTEVPITVEWLDQVHEWGHDNPTPTAAHNRSTEERHRRHALIADRAHR